MKKFIGENRAKSVKNLLIIFIEYGTIKTGTKPKRKCFKVPIVKKCEFCGKDFKAKPSQYDSKKYCSKACHNNSMRKTVKKICLHCKIEFIDNSNNKKQVYCSRKCRHETQRTSIPYELIYNLYITKNMNTRDIGKELGVSKHKISDTLKYYNLEIRAPHTQRKGGMYNIPAKEELENLYFNEYMNYEKIGEIYKTELSNVGLWFKRYGIKARKYGEGKRSRNFIYPTVQEIEELYINKGLTSYELAPLFNTTPNTICKIIKDYGFDTKPNLWLGRKFIKCKDGHEVRSNLERIVDEYLYENNISHEYEKRLPGESYRYMTDFYANNFYVEIWGVVNSKTYNEKRAKKEQIYKINHLKLISIEPQDFKDLKIVYEKLNKLIPR